MKAVFIEKFGDIESLVIKEVEMPRKPMSREALIRVHAAGLNRADILQRKGLYPPPKGTPERIPGLEFAGEIVEIGKSVKRFKPGDRVFGIASGAAQAEFITVHEGLLMKIPSALNFVEAAAIAEVFITAHDALFTLAKIKKGENVLIHAVGSGVGTAALQLAKLAGANTFGTSRSTEKLQKSFGIGLQHPILASQETDFTEYLKAHGGADVVLDLVGAAYFNRNLDVLRAKGRLILVGLTSGSKVEFNLGLALSKRLRIIGTVLRSRSISEKSAAIKKFSSFLRFFETGELKPMIDRVFKMHEIRQAHEYLEANRNFGKVVLEIF